MSSKLTVIGVLSLVCAGVGAQAPPTTQAPVSVGGSALTRAQERNLQSFALRALDSELAPGFAVAIVRNDAVVYSAGFGYADLEAGEPVTSGTLYYTASLTKALTAATVVQLAFDDLIDLNAPLSAYWPELGSSATSAYAAARIRDLLSHSPGASNGAINFYTTWIGQYQSDAELSRILTRYSTREEGFQYANTNYALLSYTISKLSDTPWQNVMQERVFEPVGMDSSTAYVSRLPSSGVARPYRAIGDSFERIVFPKTDDTITGAGGIFSTVSDLAQFVIAQLNGGEVPGREQEGLAPGVVTAMQEPAASLRAQWFEFDRYAYGLGLYLSTYRDYQLIHHFGGIGGYRSHMSWMPSEGLGVVVLQNTGGPEGYLADVVATFIYDMLLGEPNYLARADSRLEEIADRAGTERESRRAMSELRRDWENAGPAALPLSDYAGEYVNDRLGRPVIRLEGEGLVLDWGAWQTRMYAAGGHEFLVPFPTGDSAIRWAFSIVEGEPTILDWDGRMFMKK